MDKFIQPTILSPVPTIQVDLARLSASRSSPANNYYTNAELRVIAGKVGLKNSGTKAQLVARIKGALTDPVLPPQTVPVQFTTPVQFVPTSPYFPTTNVPETPLKTIIAMLASPQDLKEGLVNDVYVIDGNKYEGLYKIYQKKGRLYNRINGLFVEDYYPNEIKELVNKTETAYKKGFPFDDYNKANSELNNLMEKLSKKFTMSFVQFKNAIEILEEVDDPERTSMYFLSVISD